MSVLVKPHSASVANPSNINGLAFGTPFTVACQVTPMTPGYAYQQFGVESTNPALLLCETADGASIALGAKVTVLGVEYRVESIAAYSSIGGADHAAVMMTKVKTN